jgi:hypothetical protein
MKNYKNRQVTPEQEADLETYFFPKHIPPVSIKAASKEEAERKLQELDNNKDHE